MNTRHAYSAWQGIQRLQIGYTVLKFLVLSEINCIISGQSFVGSCKKISRYSNPCWAKTPQPIMTYSSRLHPFIWFNRFASSPLAGGWPPGPRPFGAGATCRSPRWSQGDPEGEFVGTDPKNPQGTQVVWKVEVRGSVISWYFMLFLLWCLLFVQLFLHCMGLLASLRPSIVN